MVNVTGWRFGSEKTLSVEVFSEWRFLLWLDDASDISVVLWVLLPVPLTLMAPPESLLSPKTREKVAQAHGKPSRQGSTSSAGHPLASSPGMEGGQVPHSPSLSSGGRAGQAAAVAQWQKCSQAPTVLPVLCPAPPCPHQQPLLIGINSSALLVSAYCALQLM